ncbi:MAG: CopG family transcriptional regulator [Candidatus Altiarchaeales archaeon]|nr:MAG: CopG family transcriptional regulator [Candidatus Altiarchaeales archaeon]RLI94904.1 MAG: CopG family transcriptional regulator [Candidatus Altiarchaeales archaeon]HDO82162.1 CopG family transcriptional regulator [Candidatus Altiarchaeales archaeon]HEX54811.1 CopG family transcriptional regulator [Candidatus Altiarchaeales archaeon]
MEEKEKKFTSVSIPVPLFEKIKKRINGTGFTSVSDYVTFVLREILAEEEEDEGEEPFTKEDEEKVKERLRALGYLD